MADYLVAVWRRLEFLYKQAGIKKAPANIAGARLTGRGAEIRTRDLLLPKQAR